MGVTGGTLLGVAELSEAEKIATIALVRALEHELFGEGADPVGRYHPARRYPLAGGAPVEHLNELRAQLGWLEVDSSGHWRWPS